MTETLGLTTEAAKSLLSRYGANQVVSHRHNSPAKLLARQFTSPIILILIAATLLSMFLGDVVDGAIILAIIVPSGLLSFWQEYRADQTVSQLTEQLEVEATVTRDSKLVKIKAVDLVPGDLVHLHPGEIISADLVLVDSMNLQTNESALTGESLPVEKVAFSAADFAQAPENTRLFLGTHVASGSGSAVVVATGRSTRFADLVSQLQTKDLETSFERGSKRFGLMLIRSMLVLVAALLITNVLLHKPLIDSLLFSLALAVGLTPQLLPAIITVSLATGARELAKNKVLVKRLDSIEDFGAMNVLCTDKTGTLTVGVASCGGALDAAGEPSARANTLAWLNAKLQQSMPNQLDQAIIDKFSTHPSQKDLTWAASANRVDEIAYDFERRRLSVLVSAESGNLLITKGAFEEVLSTCEVSNTKQIRTQFEMLAGQGNRVLAIASKPLGTKQKLSKSDEAGMTFEGFLIFKDEVKPDAIESITELEGLGISVYLISGDNRLTVAAVAAQANIPSTQICTGAELSKLNPNQVRELVKTCQVYAEIDPLHKELIVESLKANRNTVGFFGDGINDSAALKVADVGISVENAVPIARSSASIVLLDQSLAVVAAGVRLGRKTFENTMKYVRVTISANFGNMLSMAAAAAFMPFLPMLPIQILLLNFLSDFPALTIARDNVDESELKQPHSWDLKKVRNFMIGFGLLSSIFDLSTFYVLTQVLHADESLFQTGWFVESCLTEIIAMLVLRTKLLAFNSKVGKGLMISSIAVAVLVWLIPFSPIAGFLKMTPMPAQLQIAILALAAGYGALNEVAKKVLYRRNDKAPVLR